MATTNTHTNRHAHKQNHRPTGARRRTQRGRGLLVDGRHMRRRHVRWHVAEPVRLCGTTARAPGSEGEGDVEVGRGGQPAISAWVLGRPDYLLADAVLAGWREDKFELFFILILNICCVFASCLCI